MKRISMVCKQTFFTRKNVKGHSSQGLFVQGKRVIIRMQTYGENQQISTVLCNKCGRTLKVENGIIKEECIHVQQNFGYFTEKDGTTETFDLCGDCYEQLVKEFKIPVKISEIKEYL